MFPRRQKVIENENNPYKNFTTFIPIKLDYGLPTHLEFNPSDQSQFIVTHGSIIEIVHDVEKKVNKRRYKDDVFSASFRSDGELFVCGDATGKVKVVRNIISAKDTAPLREFSAHKGPVQTVKFFDNTQIVTGSDDRTAHVYNFLTETRVATLTGHTDYIRSCAVKDNYIFTGGYDHELRIWDIRDPTKPIHYQKLDSPITSICPENLVVHVASGESVHSISLLKYNTINVLHHTKTVTSVWMNKSGNRLVSAGLDRAVRVWEGSQLCHTVAFDAGVLCCAVADDEKQLVVGLDNKTLMKSRREDKMIRKRRVEVETLISNNYQNLIEGYLTDQLLRFDEDVNIPITRQSHLHKFGRLLNRHKYKTCLDLALSERFYEDPMVPLSLLRELVARRQLLNALDARDNVGLKPVLIFLNRYIRDVRYASLVVPLAIKVINIYGCMLGKDDVIDKLFRGLRRRVNEEIESMKNMSELKGVLDTLINASLMHA
ncbi:U3 small nucleolar RNA-associated protein [Acrasis kona]|uniref:U3 small nucleolar RNA-associated protein n=1 Tax=Acrasis kona TaxID=1008807 RepID=A0AAW2Z5T1_9EUKA